MNTDTFAKITFTITRIFCLTVTAVALLSIVLIFISATLLNAINLNSAFIGVSIALCIIIFNSGLLSLIYIEKNTRPPPEL